MASVYHIVWLCLLLGVSGHTKHCVDDYDDLKVGDTCKATWKDVTDPGKHVLLPTQPSLGYAWVHQEQETHFSSKKDAEKELKKDQFPVVLGQGHFYLTDRHHHAAALQLSDDKDIFDLDMQILVICDLRSLGDQDFWPKMKDMHYVFLQTRASPFALPSPTTETALPQSWTLESFQDDLWRSLAGFADHVKEDDQRCYLKKCEEYFVDFQWGFAINKATEEDPTLWPSSSERSNFHAKLHSLPYPSLKAVDLQSWQELGELVLPLCHSSTLDMLPLPTGYSSETLQGYSGVPVPKDPSCDYGNCRSAAAERDVFVV